MAQVSGMFDGGILGLGLSPELEEELRKRAVSAALSEAATASGEQAVPQGSLRQVAGGGVPAIVEASRQTIQMPQPMQVDVGRPAVQAQVPAFRTEVQREPEATPPTLQPALPRSPERRNLYGEPSAFDPSSLLGGIMNVISLGGYGQGYEEGRKPRDAREAKNDTFNFLLQRGVEEPFARAMVSNPDILKAVLPSMLGGSKDWQPTEIYGPDGRKMKVMVNKNDPKQMVPLGFAGPSQEEVMANRDDRREESRIRIDQHKSDNKAVSDARIGATQGNELVAQVEQMRQLRKGINYEGLPLGVSSGISTIAGLFGQGEGQAVANLAMQMQGTIRQKGEGAVSNYERQLFENRSPGLAMSDAGAELVLEGMEAVGQRKAERAKFLEAFRRQNRSLDGAEEAWGEFMAEKPLLTEGTDGKLKLNKENVGGWREYLGRKDPAGSAPGGASASNPASSRLRWNPATGEFE